jgi:hypothetical protein
MLSKEIRCQELKKLGYKEVLQYNREPYNKMDKFFCPQAPGQYLLYFVKDRTLIEKNGRNGFQAVLSTQIKTISDIGILHQEINQIIYNQDESTFKEKFNSGCMISLLFLVGLTVFTLL